MALRIPLSTATATQYCDGTRFGYFACVVDVVAAELDWLHARIGGRFTRSEPRVRAREYVTGLIAGLERNNAWTLAERAGEVGPDGMQRLLRRADWDVDGVRDDVREHVAARLGDRDTVLIVDGTGFLKKGLRSAGVQRQHSGTADRTENDQIGVFFAYASRHGSRQVDRVNAAMRSTANWLALGTSSMPPRRTVSACATPR